jgi:hypothetical protein
MPDFILLTRSLLINHSYLKDLVCGIPGYDIMAFDDYQGFGRTLSLSSAQISA